MKKKRSKMNQIIQIVGRIILGMVLLVFAGIGVLTIAEYRPEPVEELIIHGEADGILEKGVTYELLSWNIGYGALGEEADFFMDGGTHVSSSTRDEVIKNLEGIYKTIDQVSPDFVMLQEVDVDSKRSYRIDEVSYIMDGFTGFQEVFAYNYKAIFVPYPVPPIGKVNAGLDTISSFNIAEADRISLPCPFQWPMRVANLKRCLQVNRLPIAGTKRELVLINLHLEAYDDGEGKMEQTRMLYELLESELQAGNYVIAGGDFNQTFSSVDTSQYPILGSNWAPSLIDEQEFAGDFAMLMDSEIPSCRLLDQALVGADPDCIQYYLLDGFIVSSNIEILSMGTVDTGFVYADHNPISLQFQLKE